jgi:prolyl 4-hydroxylase
MRYTPGQEYKPHLDALAGLRNQREWTAIAYLNTDYDGGETIFPLLSISIRAEPGDILIFRNIDGDGDPDPRLRHAGRPVTRGAKWIATRWIRNAEHDPYDRGQPRLAGSRPSLNCSRFDGTSTWSKGYFN